MSYGLSPKTAMNLMQNNDLPPPTKLFAGRDGIFLSSIGKVYDDDHIKMYGDVDNKLEILKALHLSQTRATEAERKLRIVSGDKEALSRLLVDESMILFAHRQWLTLLEFQLLKQERERGMRLREAVAATTNGVQLWHSVWPLLESALLLPWAQYFSSD